jgi:hypothetical protein
MLFGKTEQIGPITGIGAAVADRREASIFAVYQTGGVVELDSAVQFAPQ